jgi:MFS family permease
MSPPALTLTSRLAPEGRLGRYMGVYSFFTSAGWSLGPLYGGWFLDRFGTQPQLAWLLIASLALVAFTGFLWFGRHLNDMVNR